MEYRPLEHKAILFDEASCAMVLRKKKLFQAGAHWVSMAQSTTNCYSYTIWAHRKYLVICSNSWTSELARLKPASRAWLQKNSVHVMVTEPLWQEPRVKAEAHEPVARAVDVQLP